MLLKGQFHRDIVTKENHYLTGFLLYEYIWKKDDY